LFTDGEGVKMGANKSKFKVGDRVRLVGGGTFSNGATEVTVADKRTSDDEPYFVETDTWMPNSALELVKSPSASPIRTITRREIVPGVYGIAKVDGMGGTNRRVGISIDYGYTNADQLREAAHLFNQLAEVLEENAAADKKEAA